MKKIYLVLLGLAVAAAVSASAAPVVVTHPELGSETIDGGTIKAVFRGKKVAWSNKTPVTVAILKGGTVHEEFLKTAFNISASAFSNHWRLTAMTGGGVAPKEFATEQELLQFVSSTPGAIGYVDEASAGEAVRKVAIN